jgi:hypothetical protein
LRAHLQDVASPEARRRRYRAHDGERVRGVAVRSGLDEEQPVDPRRIEDAACRPRWREIEHDRPFDPRKSLLPQGSLGLSDREADRAAAGAGAPQRARADRLGKS